MSKTGDTHFYTTYMVYYYNHLLTFFYKFFVIENQVCFLQISLIKPYFLHFLNRRQYKSHRVPIRLA